MGEILCIKRKKQRRCRGSNDVGKQNGGSSKGMRPLAMGNPFEEFEQTTDFTTWFHGV